MKKMVSGNEAIAYGALNAGVRVITGYPGTPSSEVIGSIWNRTDLEGTHIEWSTNEKVAIEVAGAASWAGVRCLTTMKMSGLNVAYDALIGYAQSGCNAGFVIYVTDDPGVTTGMVEQDIRGFALMSDMVMLEPGTVAECYDIIKYAFELSEAIETPVFVRGVTNISQSHAMVDIGERTMPKENTFVMTKDSNKYSKAGPIISMTQHQKMIDNLAIAEKLIEEKGLNELVLKEKGGLGVISVGVANCYVEEGIEIANRGGLNIDLAKVSTLKLRATVPFAHKEIDEMLNNCSTILILEELEPHLEKQVYLQAYQLGVKVKIVGKIDDTLSRLNEYNAAVAAKGYFGAMGKEVPEELVSFNKDAQKIAAARPITVCAGCPHRGTYLSINKALRNLKLKKDEVMVTGDIGCTILGMNPPFETVWSEVCMGTSIPGAHGYYVAGWKTPVIATIGDSTFFHAGLPGLVNAIQNNVNITVCIMDNSWTAMTGMQVNPNTAQAHQRGGNKQLDLVRVVKGLGIEDDHLFVVDPYDLEATTKAFQDAIALDGVKVIITRRECAIQAARQKVKYGHMTVDPDKCIRCKVCINVTGCPAISLGEKSIEFDYAQCNACGICSQVCPKSAITKEAK